jgi:hypothetical protein
VSLFLVKNKPVPAGERKLKRGHCSQLQLHLAREPRTPVDRENRVFFSPGTGLCRCNRAIPPTPAESEPFEVSCSIPLYALLPAPLQVPTNHKISQPLAPSGCTPLCTPPCPSSLLCPVAVSLRTTK